MKIKYAITAVLALALALTACDKETEGLSRVTYYCELELQGPSTVLVSLDGQYNEPGYIATENGEDVSSNVIVSGAVNTAKPGLYTLVYTANNSDGFPKTASRTVIVYDTTPSSLESGFYHLSPESNRNGAASREYSTQPPVLIYQEAPGQFYLSDLFGGYYNVGRGYGAAYATSGTLSFDGENFSLLKSGTTPWGDKFTEAEGAYDAATKTITLKAVWEAGYTFNLIIIKD
ncbi:MAG: DUF5012 domain-containing protein [Tannerellaceae bacterium]|nr:DUF5012 domain-containing protein [Tannerellaceae bacterium]